MVIKFNSTSYLRTIKSNSELDDVSKIFNHANKKLKFEYGDVNYKKFKENHSPVNWKGRKVVAIPAAMLAVVKAVCHLAIAILIGGLDILFNANAEFFKVYFLKVIRDGQESFGWIITLFHDSYGQFHVEEADFQKTCYDCNLVKPSLSRTEPKKPEAPVSPPAKSAYTPPKPAPAKSATAPSAIYPNFKAELAKIEKKWIEEGQEAEYLQLARDCFNIGDRDNALIAIEKIWRDKSKKENFITRVAEVYCDEGNLDKAYELFDKLSFNHPSKDKGFKRIAQAYLERNDPEKAETFLKKLSFSSISDSDPIYEKLALGYINSGKLEDAYRIGTKHKLSNLNSTLLVLLAQAYYIQKDRAKVIKCLAELFPLFMEEKLINTNQYRDYLHFKSVAYEIFQEFNLRCAEVALDECEKHFIENNTMAIKQVIKIFATDDATIKNLLMINSKISP